MNALMAIIACLLLPGFVAGQDSAAAIKEAQAQTELAVEFQSSGRFHESAATLRRLLQMYEGHPNPPPLDVAAVWHNLGIAYRGLGRRAEAEAAHRKSIQMIERAGGPAHPKLVVPMSFLGVLLIEQGRVADADVLFTRALRIANEALGPKHPDAATALIGLAQVRRIRGDLASARMFADRAARMIENGSNSVAVLHELATIEFEMGRLRPAAAYWRQALEIVSTKRTPEHPDALNIKVRLAEIARLERHPEAEQLLLEVVRTAENTGAQSVLAVALHRLGILYAKQNEHDRAEPLFRRSLEITKIELGSANAQFGLCVTDYAQTLVALKHVEEASELTASAIGAIEQAGIVRDPWFVELLQQHERVLRSLKRKDEARRVSERVKAILASTGNTQAVHTVGVGELMTIR